MAIHLLKTFLVSLAESREELLEIRVFSSKHLFIVRGKVKFLCTISTKDGCQIEPHKGLKKNLFEEIFGKDADNADLTHFLELPSYIGPKVPYHLLMMTNEERNSFHKTKRLAVSKTLNNIPFNQLVHEFQILNLNGTDIDNWTYHIDGSMLETVFLIPFLIPISKTFERNGKKKSTDLYDKKLRDIVHQMWEDYLYECWHQNKLKRNNDDTNILNTVVLNRLKIEGYFSAEAIEAEDITNVDFVRNVPAHLQGSMMKREYTFLNPERRRPNKDFGDLPLIHSEMKCLYQGKYMCLMWRVLHHLDF